MTVASRPWRSHKDSGPLSLCLPEGPAQTERNWPTVYGSACPTRGGRSRWLRDSSRQCRIVQRKRARQNGDDAYEPLPEGGREPTPPNGYNASAKRIGDSSLAGTEDGSVSYFLDLFSPETY